MRDKEQAGSPRRAVAQPVLEPHSCTRSSVPAGDGTAGGTLGSREEPSPRAGTGKDLSWEWWESGDSAEMAPGLQVSPPWREWVQQLQRWGRREEVHKVQESSGIL